MSTATRPLATDGLSRWAASPGLWLDPVAWHAGDGPAQVVALDRGQTSPEYAAFAVRFAGAAG